MESVNVCQHFGFLSAIQFLKSLFVQDGIESFFYQYVSLSGTLSSQTFKAPNTTPTDFSFFQLANRFLAMLSEGVDILGVVPGSSFLVGRIVSEIDGYLDAFQRLGKGHQSSSFAASPFSRAQWNLMVFAVERPGCIPQLRGCERAASELR
jgi:hypothetical protein